MAAKLQVNRPTWEERPVPPKERPAEPLVMLRRGADIIRRTQRCSRAGAVTGGMQEGTPMAQPTGRGRLLASVPAAQRATGVAGMVIGLGRC